MREELPAPALNTSSDDLFRKVKSAVMTRIGGQVDEAVLDAVISRVIQRMK